VAASGTSKLLVGMLVISLLTNIVFAVRLQYPGTWRQLRLAMAPSPQLTFTDHVRGPDDAAITVIIYTNYQCPYCAKLNENLTALATELDFRWSYRHYTDYQNQPLAFKAAMATECAGEQGQFWGYNDSLFSSPQLLSDDHLHHIAQQLNLDMTAFMQCTTLEKYRDALISTRQQARNYQITATPTYFINGKRVIGLKPYAELKQILISAQPGL
jgi:protein-disulfide isomerase